MKRIVLYLLLAFQILGLVALYAWQSQTPGPRYLLQTRPVDPRDLLRGDYVILGYEISTPPKEWRDAN
ncbi:MAG TPA: GDYXXLXY domain-containing protein, partial [Chthoniobacterales bacterium]